MKNEIVLYHPEVRNLGEVSDGYDHRKGTQRATQPKLGAERRALGGLRLFGAVVREATRGEQRLIIKVPSSAAGLLWPAKIRWWHLIAC